MRQITSIAIHCSATKPGQDIGVAEIRGWHKAKGWSDIGYHWVIRRDGRLEQGRGEEVPGAHVEGHNSKSIGVCMVGGVDDRNNPDNNFTPEQWTALKAICTDLARRYPAAVFKGHRDYPGVKKACPSFDARAWAKQNGLKTEAAPAAARPVLRSGDSGDDVKVLQAALARAGYGVTVDGAFGPKTERAVVAFQTAKGLFADGVYGDATRRALTGGA